MFFGIRIGISLYNAMIEYRLLTAEDSSSWKPLRFRALSEEKVVATQIPAKTLYETLGFVVYGLEKEALYVEGRFQDEYHMQLFLP